jgi:hypothetical protein
VITIGAYEVRINTPNGNQKAFLYPATSEDMPTDWEFFWQNLWLQSDFDYQGIVKLIYANTIWGLIRYSVFPFEDRQIVEIEHLEANPISTYQKHPRLVEPIGKWLIWYVAKLALTRCSCADTDTLIILASVTDAVDYYGDTIKMEYLGNAPSAPGEDAYAFRFTREKATEFCVTQERQCGIASSFES